VLFNLVTKDRARINDLTFEDAGDRLVFRTATGILFIIEPEEIAEIKYYAYGNGTPHKE